MQGPEARKLWTLYAESAQIQVEDIGFRIPIESFRISDLGHSMCESPVR